MTENPIRETIREDRGVLLGNPEVTKGLRLIGLILAFGAIAFLMVLGVAKIDPHVGELRVLTIVLSDVGIGIIAALIAIATRE